MKLLAGVPLVEAFEQATGYKAANRAISMKAKGDDETMTISAADFRDQSGNRAADVSEKLAPIAASLNAQFGQCCTVEQTENKGTQVTVRINVNNAVKAANHVAAKR